MAQSYRSDLTKVIAATRFPRDREGRPILPRVVERTPRQGDIHPLQREHITAFLNRLPIDYVYGLRRVELRARTDEIGCPFGYYRRKEKTVVLYSVPSDIWIVPADKISKETFESYGAEVRITDESAEIHWKNLEDLAYFLHYIVFLHELGHHFHNQYRSRNKHPRYYAAQEASADRHALKLEKRNIFARWYALQKRS